MSSETIRKSLFKAMNNGNIRFFNAELKRMGLNHVEVHKFPDDSKEGLDNPKKYTLMQYASKNGLADMVLALLNFGVDPNVADENNESCPVLLAAEYGHFHILQLLKDCSTGRNDRKPHQRMHRIHTKTNLAFEHNEIDMTEMSFKCSADFRVMKKETKETVLHLVLKRSVRQKLSAVCSCLIGRRFHARG